MKDAERSFPKRIKTSLVVSSVDPNAFVKYQNEMRAIGIEFSGWLRAAWWVDDKKRG